MNCLYHCTQLRFVDKIIREGLKANHPLQRENKSKGVYLSEYKFNWMWNTQRSGYYKGAVIKINVDGLKLIKDYHENEIDKIVNSKGIGQDFICVTDIEPERIIEILIETEINTFQKLTGWKKFRNKKN